MLAFSPEHLFLVFRAVPAKYFRSCNQPTKKPKAPVYQHRGFLFVGFIPLIPRCWLLRPKSEGLFRQEVKEMAAKAQSLLR